MDLQVPERLLTVIVVVALVVKAAWYIGVPTLLFLIWKKVRHLPG